MQYKFKKGIIFIRIFLLTSLFGCFVSFDSSEEGQALPSLKGKKVLIVHGGWDGHQPDLYAKKVHGWLSELGAVVTVSDSLGVYANQALMAEMDLIIQSVTMSTIEAEAFKGLEAAVRNGAGYAGSHGGFCDAYRDNTDYQYMTGAQFVKHPGGIVDFTVNIVDDQDAVTAGVETFSSSSEQYYLHIDPNVKVLATTTFSGEHDAWIEGAVMPVIWKKYHGKGRVFCITLGHDPNEFDQPIPQQLLLNGFRWASGSKYQPRENLLNPVYKKN